MSKFTFKEKAQIKSIVATLTLKRISDDQIIEFILGRTNKTIGRMTLYNIRQEIKRDSFEWYNHMRQDQYAYIHEYKQRINEITDLQEMHHDIVIRNRNNPAIQQTSLAELHRLNITLSNYIDVLPYVINGTTVPATSEDKTISASEAEQSTITV